MNKESQFRLLQDLSVSGEKIISIDQCLQELLIFEVENCTHFNCIGNPIYLTIYVGRAKRYLHSVKSNDSFQIGRLDCEKIKEI